VIVYCLISAFINAVTSLVLGVAVWLRRPAGNPNLPFVFFAFTVGLWSAFYVLWQLAGDVAQATIWIHWLSAAAILVPPTYYHFADRLVGSSHRFWVTGGYIGGGVLALLSFTPWICASVSPLRGFPFWPRAGMLYPAYLAFFAAYTVLSWANLFIALRAATHMRRNQLKYVFAGTTLGFLGGATNFPMWYELPVPPVGNGLVAFYVVGVAYAIIRFRLLEVNYVVTKLAAYVVAALPLAVIYPGVFVLLERLSHDFLVASISWFVVSLPLSFGAFLVLPALKRRLDELLERTLLKPFVTGRERLRELAYEVAGMRDETDIFRRSAEVIATALGSSAAFHVRGELDANYRLRAAHATDPSAVLPEEIGDDDPILSFVRRQQRAILLDEIATLEPESWPAVSAAKAKRRVEVVVAVHADGYFYGILTLGGRRRQRVFSDTELSLLDSVCLQIGLHVRARQIERRANQSEKLISLGTLAAGLAHEMRNPLVSIKTFASLLDENANDKDFQR
jgi:two-component system nitrogen regulation sensor histidine kinase GlnL